MNVLVAHLGEKLVLILGASTLCVMKPYPQSFMMQLNTIKLHNSWYLVSLTIQSYTILLLFYLKCHFYQIKVIMLYNVHTTYLIFVDTQQNIW